MSVFGWCSDGHHLGCPAVIRRLVSYEGRVVTTEAVRHCECQCHNERRTEDG